MKKMWNPTQIGVADYSLVTWYIQLLLYIQGTGTGTLWKWGLASPQIGFMRQQIMANVK
jgi:hypothetical protein